MVVVVGLKAETQHMIQIQKLPFFLLRSFGRKNLVPGPSRQTLRQPLQMNPPSYFPERVGRNLGVRKEKSSIQDRLGVVCPLENQNIKQTCFGDLCQEMRSTKSKKLKIWRSSCVNPLLLFLAKNNHPCGFCRGKPRLRVV